MLAGALEGGGSSSSLRTQLRSPYLRIQTPTHTQDFYRNFQGDPLVKIPWVRKDLSSRQVLVMEWIEGVRCSDVLALQASGIDLEVSLGGGGGGSTRGFIISVFMSIKEST